MEANEYGEQNLGLLEAKILSAGAAIVAWEGREAGLARIGSLLQSLEQVSDGSLPSLGSEQGSLDLE